MTNQRRMLLTIMLAMCMAFLLARQFVVLAASEATENKSPLIPLTREEIAFLKDHPEIRVSNEKDWPPFDYMENGQPTGLSIDYLNLISQRLGVRFKYVNGFTWNELLSMGYDKKIDLLHTMIKTPERSDKLLFTMPYIVQRTVFVVRKQSEPIQSFNELKGLKLAYPKGYADYEMIRRTYPEVQIISVDGAEAGVRAVVENRADAYYDNVFVVEKIIKKNAFSNITYYSSLDVTDPNATYLRLGIRDDWPVFKGILEKAMASITFEEKEALSNRWTEGVNQFYQPEDLTSKEQLWLKSHQTLHVAVFDGQPPLSYFDQKGVYSGIASEYITELEKRLGISLTIQKVDSLEAGLESVESGAADILVPIAADVSLEEKMFFTQPIYTLPIVIYGNDRHPLVQDLYTLGTTQIAVLKNTALQGWLAKDYPDLKLFPVASRLEAIKSIEDGGDMILIDEFLTVNQLIINKGFSRVRTVGSMNYQYDAAIAVRKDMSDFRTILQKTLQKIQQEKRNIITQKWLSRNVESGPDYRDMMKVAAVALAITIILLFRTVVVEKLLRKISKQMVIIDHNVLSIEMTEGLEIEKISTALVKLLKIHEHGYLGKHVADIFPDLSAFEPDAGSDATVAVRYGTDEGDFYFEGDFRSERRKNKVWGWILILRDTTALRRFEELSLKDGLTSVYNRRAYDLFLPREIKLAQRNRQIMAYMILDLDNFKKYNDYYGHLAGDDALKAVAVALNGILRRPSDYVFRIGGEEFIVITHHLSENEAIQFAEVIRQSVEALQIEHVENLPWQVLTISLGICLITEAELEGVDEIYRRADRALYQAKMSGRNVVRQS